MFAPKKYKQRSHQTSKKGKILAVSAPPWVQDHRALGPSIFSDFVPLLPLLHTNKRSTSLFDHKCEISGSSSV